MMLKRLAVMPLHGLRVKSALSSSGIRFCFNVGVNPSDSFSLAARFFRDPPPEVVDWPMDEPPSWKRTCTLQDFRGNTDFHSTEEYSAIHLESNWWSTLFASHGKYVNSLTLMARYNSPEADLMESDLRHIIDSKYKMEGGKISFKQVMEILHQHDLLFVPEISDSGVSWRFLLSTKLFVEYARVVNLHSSGFPNPNQFYSGLGESYEPDQKLRKAIESVCHPVPLFQLSKTKPNSIEVKKEHELAVNQMVQKTLPAFGVCLPSRVLRFLSSS